MRSIMKMKNLPVLRKGASPHVDIANAETREERCEGSKNLRLPVLLSVSIALALSLSRSFRFVCLSFYFTALHCPSLALCLCVSSRSVATFDAALVLGFDSGCWITFDIATLSDLRMRGGSLILALRGGKQLA